MNTHGKRFPVSAVSLAVRSALLLIFAAPSFALAQQVMSDEVKELVYPTSWFDLGVLALDQSSTKFGEYNGLNTTGPYLLADFGVKGGSAYGMGDGTTRVEATGTNLGTSSRNIGLQITDQGQWSAGASYDQLKHYTTENYQTPYQGAQGSNFFNLLPTFGVINTTTTTTNGVITSASKGAQTLTSTQLSQYRGDDVYNERDTTSVNAGYLFNKEWNFKFDYRRIDQSGAKLIAGATDAYNLTSLKGFNYGGERVAYLMNPTEYATDMFTFSLNWAGQNAFFSVGYYGSLFHDDYSGVSFSNPFVSGGTGAAPVPPTGTSPGAAFPISTFSTPPSNSLHQFNLSGGWIFTPGLKLVGSFSYGHNEQNESYDGTYTTTPNTVPLLPVGSLDGKVDIKHADAKLTWQLNPAWLLAAGAKYNERDNKTASYTYEYVDLGGEERSAVNTPLSTKREQFDAGADWRITSTQKLHFGYDYDYVERWCQNALANNAQGELSAANAGYYTTASCVQIPKDRENRLGGTYRIKAWDSFDFNAGYTWGRREATVNPSFYNPMQSVAEGFENFGYRAFFAASREQNLVKAGVNWQATPKFSIGLNGRYAHDDYFDSPLGVQNGKTESANLDANYGFSENNSIGGYFTYQKRTRDLLTASGRNAVAPLTTLWSNDLADRSNAVGLDARQKGLMGGKLEFREDLTYNLAKTKYVTFLGPGITPNLSNQGEVPNISSELKEFRITSGYHIDRQSSIFGGYQYQKLTATDYLYNGFQYGYNPTGMLASNQQAPNYDVNLVFIAYRYSFQ
jgi:MtrB/PioB family decaheme-associated outer membrane protein